MSSLTSADNGSTTQEHLDPQELLSRAVGSVSSVLKGHQDAVRLVLAALLARGHVLLEDVPGVGKTTLARAVAKLLGDSFSRIQFTADMLPSDVIGLQRLNEQAGRLEFHPGPLFAQVVLADEINRASPKTQSATLEAMAEGSVTVDDQTHPLPKPFVVLATQNPVEHHGAYPLPESQLDRFCVALSLGYPSRHDERALLMRPREPNHNLERIEPILSPERMGVLHRLVDDVRLTDAVADYLLSLVQGTREHADVLLGCSPRGSLAFGAMARAWAFMQGRDFVLPDDVKRVALPVLGHRMVVGQTVAGSRETARRVVEEVVAKTPVPR